MRLTPEAYTFAEEQIEVNVENGSIERRLKVAKKKYSIDQDGSTRYVK